MIFVDIMQDDYKNLTYVFRLKPNGLNSIKCKQIATVAAELNTRYSDEPIDIETNEEEQSKVGKNAKYLGTVNRYMLIGRYCHCDVVGDYLLKNQTLPVYYLCVLYNRTVVTGNLFNIFLNFRINDDLMPTLNKPIKYFNVTLSGKFSLVVKSVDDNFLNEITDMVREEIMRKYVDVINENNVDEIKKRIENDLDEKMKEYNSFFEPIEFPTFPNEKKVFGKMMEMCKSLTFSELVIYGLKYREEQRAKEKCPDVSYSIPKNVIKMKDIKNHSE